MPSLMIRSNQNHRFLPSSEPKIYVVCDKLDMIIPDPTGEKLMAVFSFSGICI